MSVAIWADDELFSVRIYKRLIGRPDLVWANTYELRATASEANPSAKIQAVCRVLAAWEAKFHYNNVEFDRAIFSTLVPDGEPYDPGAFASVSVADIVGGKTLGTGNSPLPLNICLLIRKQVSFGRAGRNLYRGALVEQDVSAPAGSAVLDSAPQASIQAAVNGAITGPGIATNTGIFDALNQQGVDLVMAGNQLGVAGNIRSVLGLSVSGVVIKPVNNRYFDRGAAGNPAP